MTEDELLKARGITKQPAKKKSSSGIERRDLSAILEQVSLGAADPFGENGTAIVVLRIAGLNVMQIVNKLQLDEKTGPDHVRQVLYLARKEAKLADVSGLLDHMAVPEAVDNLIDGIRNGDKEYTLAVLKGRGAFRNFERQEADARMSLEILVEGLDKANKAAVLEGSVVGIPRAPSQREREDS